MIPRWPVALLAVGLGASSLTATVLLPADFKDIVVEATLIVRGHVTDVRGVVAASRDVESVATVAVDLTLKGEAADFLAVRLPGGTVGRYTTRLIGAPVLRRGEHAVFFLRRDRSNNWQPIGLSMGVFRLHADPESGRPVVHAPVVAGLTADLGPVRRGDPRRAPMPLASFESVVRLVLAGQTSATLRGGR